MRKRNISMTDTKAFPNAIRPSPSKRNRQSTIDRLPDSDSRAGVVLLVVLVLLSLFLVICTTLLLVAGSYRRAAQSQVREEWYGTPPQRLLDEAVYQLVRGTRDRNSILAVPAVVPTQADLNKAESLLADLYGYDGFLAYAAVDSVSGNTLRLHVPVPELDTTQSFPHASPSSAFTGGDWVLWRDVRDRGVAYFPKRVTPATSVSQAPFLYGYYAGLYLTFIDALTNPATGVLPNTLKYHTVPIVRYALRTSNSPPAPPSPFSDLPVHNGGIYANQYVYAEIDVTWPTNAYQTPSLDLPQGSLVSGIVAILVNGRPFNGRQRNPNNPADLIYPDDQYDYPDESNLFLAHPAPARNLPSFRSLFVPNLGQVDNDRDGVPDSGWVDLGFPVMTGADGRQVKPLFSILCTDLDGRLNVNYAGNRGHLRTASAWTILNGDATTGRYRPSRAAPGATPPVADLAYGNPIPSPAFGQGVGWGPADTTLWDLLAGVVETQLPGLSPSQVQNVAFAWYNQLLDTRYSTGGRPGLVGDDAYAPNAPAALKFPIYLASRALVDFHAALRQGVDPRGMPTSEPTYPIYSGTPYHPTIDSPYELNTEALRGHAPTATDTLFSTTELESLLRFFDWDSRTIPSRLRYVLFDIDGDGNPDLLPLGDAAEFRQSITTESWELPFLKFRSDRRIPPLPGSPQEPMQSPLELLSDAIINRMGGSGAPVPPWIIEDMVTRRIVPPDFVFGMPYDLNRALPEWPAGATSLSDPAVQQYYAARQEMAQQLYMLMLLVADLDPLAADPPGQQTTKMADRIAQWAVNVVDFRDGDAIMTPFEYDNDPFNGWGLDGNPFSSAENQPFAGAGPPPSPQPDERRVVWGCERPELLISEAFGWHDVRVTRRGANTYEQTDRPRGYFFVELYNPWASPVFQSDLNPWGIAPPAGVQLNATAPAGDPVWRLSVTSQHTTARNRVVYFTVPGGNAPRPNLETYYCDLINQPLYVVPGQYGVIGSVGWIVDPAANGFNADIDGDGRTDYVSTFGLPDPTTIPPPVNYTQARRIQLSRSPLGVELVRVDGLASFPKPVVAVPINKFFDAMGQPQWRSFNVSEPYPGYPILPVIDPMEQRYVTPPSTPFDENEHIQNGAVVNPSDNYAEVELERLANPFLSFDPNFNPYMVIDHFDHGSLTRINGAASDPPSDNDTRSHERNNMLWSHDNPQPSTNVITLSGGAHYYSRPVKCTLGFLNSTMGAMETSTMPAGVTPPWLPPDYYVGAPSIGPFPFLTWLNRPFRNQFELLEVPATNAEDLLHKFQPPGTYIMPNNTHLLPIIDYRASGGQQISTRPQSQFYHILHFTRTRSPFLGAETYLSSNPTDIYPRREPGRVNINTMPNQFVWLGLWNGVEVPEGQSGNLSNTWVPLFSEILPVPPTSNQFSPPYFPSKLGDDIDRDQFLWLFATNSSNPRGRKNWPNAAEGISYLDGSLHTYYRFHGLNRIGGSVTTTSNVYAVWVTVGFFDLDPNTGQIVAEHGSETGEQKRHRAFYIIDRSIPVAFEPGENHNVDRAFLLKRFIE